MPTGVPNNLRHWSPALLRLVADVTAIPEVVVLHDPSPAELEVCTLDPRLAVIAIVSTSSEARAAALRAGALEALDPELPEVESRARVETAIARFRTRSKAAKEAAHGFDSERQSGLLRRDMILASKVQQSFLPRSFPELAGYRFAVCHRPRDLVTGDSYEIRALDRDHVAIYTSDAMGHGISAALVNVALRSRFRPLADDPSGPRIRPPHEVLGELDASLREADLAESPTVAFCYGVLDVPRRRLALANAGHPLPIRLRADGNMDLVGTTCLLLGVVPEQYETVEVELSPGDRVFFATDGAEPAYGKRFPEELRARSALPLAQQVEGALAAVLVPGEDGLPDDDVTVVALEVLSADGIPDERSR